MAQFVYRCSDCGATYDRAEVRYLCPRCGERYAPGRPLPGVLEAVFDATAVRRKFDPRRPDWALLCAVETEYHPPFPCGQTPFQPAPRLGRILGLADLWIKNDGLNPSGSLKDRASFLVVAEAIRLGQERIVTASTGNAASALAAVCAAAGRRAVIFVPRSAPRAKLVQMLLHGATVIRVEGTYDDAFRLSLEYTWERGGLNRNTAYHPLTIEGKKTAALEIYAQNGCRAPDAVIVPVGDGVIISGVYKGFRDLLEAGLIQRLPRLVAVQAERSDAIHRFITSGRYRNAPHPATIADSISVATPSNAAMARRAVLESGGFSLTVSDDEIRAAQGQLAATTGVFAEPAAAATLAGLAKALRGDSIQKDAHGGEEPARAQRARGTHANPPQPALDPAGRIVLLITGHGLKDIDTPLSALSVPPPVPPELKYVKV